MKKLFVIFFLFSAFAFADTPQEESLKLNEQGVKEVQKKDFDDAEELFLDALDKDPYNLTAVFNLAGMYLTTEQNENAVKLLKHYTERYPEDAGLHARLGDALFSSEDAKGAIEQYKKALELDSKYPNVNGKLGTAYTLMNDIKAAEKHYELAVKEKPLDYDLLSSLSSLQLANGNAKDSVRTAKKALQVKASSEVYITLGTAYEIQENYENSLIAFQRAQDLGDESEDLETKITELKEKVAGKS